MSSEGQSLTRGLEILLSVACGICVASLYYIQPLEAVVAGEFGISAGAAGIAVTCVQLGYAAGREITISFTPHLVPMNRGILATEYASLTKVNGKLPDKETIREAYEKYYAKENFIRLLADGVYPETRWVETSNYVDIGFKIDERTGRIVMMG